MTPLAVFEGSGVADSAARLVKTNHQGSVIALTDWNGNLLSKNSYDDWGIPAAANASIAQGGRFAYTGQAWIPGLVCIITKLASTHPRWEGSCRPIQSGIRIRSIFTPMLGMIQLT
jgi:hypothetical protein